MAHLSSGREASSGSLKLHSDMLFFSSMAGQEVEEGEELDEWAEEATAILERVSIFLGGQECLWRNMCEKKSWSRKRRGRSCRSNLVLSMELKRLEEKEQQESVTWAVSPGSLV